MNLSDLTSSSAWAASAGVDSLSATSPQRQGKMLANKAQSARPVKKHDMSWARYASGM